MTISKLIKLISLIGIVGLIVIACNNQSSTQNNQSSNIKVWVETDKYVVIEAEEADYESTEWVLTTEPAGWSGSGYLVWKGSSIWGDDKEAVAYDEIEDTRKLIYHVEITNPGIYYLKVRNYHVGKGSGDHFFDGDNDCFISMAGGEFGKQYDHNAKEFTWCETGNWRKAFLDKGIHEISMAGRSHDFGADRIALFHEDLAPAGHFGPSPHDWTDDYIWSAEAQSDIRMVSKN
jgi:hypothetical protein